MKRLKKTIIFKSGDHIRYVNGYGCGVVICKYENETSNKWGNWKESRDLYWVITDEGETRLFMCNELKHTKRALCFKCQKLYLEYRLVGKQI